LRFTRRLILIDQTIINPNTPHSSKGWERAMVEIEIVRLQVKPGAADALIGLVLEARQHYLAPPACRTVDLMRTQDGKTVVATLRWASATAHEKAASGPWANAFRAKVGALLQAAPSIEIFHEAARAGLVAGQVAIVTGGASGIGRAVVDRFVAEGARVVVVDRKTDRLASAAEAHGERVVSVVADISTAAGNEAAVAAAITNFGRIDTLILNAGVFDGFTELAALSPVDVGSRYEAIFNVNVRGPILGISAALPHLVKSRGSVILTLSIASLVPDGGGVFYVASKHAGLGIMRQLAHELAPHVRVNAVAPGATRTPIGIPDVFGITLDQQSEEVSRAVCEIIPLHRHADPEDIAGAYVLLASTSEGRNMTGTVVQCDGGLGIRGLRRVSGGNDLTRSAGDLPQETR
jgi:2,3-dihydroxy-2,3-dihydrophenylpropionate dehydrogenase